MCSRVECSTCHRPTFAGCGRHVEEVLGDVAPADRCVCRATAAGAGPTPSRGLFSFLGRKR